VAEGRTRSLRRSGVEALRRQATLSEAFGERARALAVCRAQLEKDPNDREVLRRLFFCLDGTRVLLQAAPVPPPMRARALALSVEIVQAEQERSPVALPTRKHLQGVQEDLARLAEWFQKSPEATELLRQQ